VPRKPRGFAESIIVRDKPARRRSSSVPTGSRTSTGNDVRFSGARTNITRNARCPDTFFPGYGRRGFRSGFRFVQVTFVRVRCTARGGDVWQRNFWWSYELTKNKKIKVYPKPLNRSVRNEYFRIKRVHGIRTTRPIESA